MFNFLNRKAEAQKRSNKWTFGTMFVAGLLALAASFVLTIEKFHLLENPDAVLSCSFNVILNCSTVMQTWQASVFGFPNAPIGVMAYAAVMTIALIGLMGFRFPRWYVITTHVGYFFGLVFAYWLLFQSVYVIQVLCPWCLVVTFTTTLIFATMTNYVLRENSYGFSKKVNDKIQTFLDKDYHKLIVASWIVLVIALIVLKFGEALFA
jgi:uncharacterized membrane protein